MTDLEPIDHVDKQAFAIAVFVGLYLIAVAVFLIDRPVWVQVPVVVVGWSVTYVSATSVLDATENR